MAKSQEWHEKRRNAITASDCAAIMGVSPYKSALDVYNEKINSHEQTDNPTLQRGRRAEKYVLEEYAENTGSILETEIPTLVDPKYPFLIGHIDARVKGENVIVEAKSSKFNASSWDGQIPATYLHQVAFYALIADSERVDIPVLFSNWEYACFTYYRNEEFENQIREAAINFWENHVLKRIPPEPTTLSDIAKIYPTSTAGKEISATVDIAGKMQEYSNILVSIRDLNVRKEELQVELMTYMQDAEVLNGPSNNSLTWKTYTQNRIDHALLKSDFPEVYGKCLKTYPCRTLRVINNMPSKGENCE